MHVRAFILPLICVLILGTSSAHAVPLTFSFTDPIGDQTGTIDLTGLDFTFESVTGAYVIDIFASAAHPFTGSFRINVNLFNPDTGTTAQDPALFQDTQNDITLASPTTLQQLTGTNLRLLAWDVGDRVAIRSGALGNPDGSFGFGSQVLAIPFDTLGIDVIDSADIVASISAVSTAVPEPSTILLLGIGTLSMIAYARWWSRKPVASLQ